MIVIFDKDIFVRYLSNYIPGRKNPELLNLIKIFENEKNKIVITDELIKRIENQINSSPALSNIFQQFLKNIFDDKRIIRSESQEDEIKDLTQSYDSINVNENKFIIVDKQLSQLTDYDNYIHCTCIYSNIKKTNKCWLLFNLLAGDSVTVRYSDFRSNIQIELFFNTVFDFIADTDEVYILDSYCNFHRHTLFEPLKIKGKKINVFTSSANKTSFDTTRLKNELKQHFGKTRTAVKFSSDKRLIHERTLKFRDVIIESNHDFAEINRANQNWKLDVTICQDLKGQIENKCLSYRSL